MVGVIIGVGAVAILMSLGRGTQAQMNSPVPPVATDQLVAEGQRSAPFSQLALRPAQFSSDDAALPLTLGVAIDPGLLSINDQPIASTVWLNGGPPYRFPADFEPADPGRSQAASVDDEIFGPSGRISADYRSADGDVQATLQVTASIASPALIYQIIVQSSATAPEWFSLLSAEQSRLDLPGPVQYLAAVSPGYVEGTIAPGDAEVSFSVGSAFPLVLWSAERGQGYVLSTLDQASGPVLVTLAKPDGNQLWVGMEARANPATPTVSPRLYIERIESEHLAESLAGYRAALDVVAPPLPVPAGFRHQWGTWYVYGGGITEDLIREQIDTIAERYGDLGPWQVVIDAGWYRAGADPDGEVGLIDAVKFPSGMRALVDYAHARGIRVILYGPAPWVDSRPSTTSWWVVQLGFVRDHPDWLILVDEDEEGATYVYDFANPELRAYLAQVVRRYLIDFDADGVELDMVGIIGPEGGPFRGEPFGVETAERQRGVAQAMEVYRWLWETASQLKPEVWIESGYAAPPLARQYAHSWRVADDFPAFSNPYPFVGLLEQMTLNALREQLVGARPNLGFIWGEPQDLPIQRQWLGAAVALQAQTNLSVDLAAASAATTQIYREYLAALRPFSASPVFGEGIPPEAFSTTVDGTTYLGLLNQEFEPRTITVNLADHGVGESARVIAFDPETHQPFSSHDQLNVPVAARSFRLLAVRHTPGVLWSDRSWTSEWQDGGLEVRVEPSPFGAGKLWLYAPGARPITADEAPSESRMLDAASGLWLIELPEGGAYRIHVTFPAPDLGSSS
jgi:hypothetical protein